MRRYLPSTIHRYLDLSSTQITQTHISHRRKTTLPLQTLSKPPIHSPHRQSTPPQPKHRYTSNMSPVLTALVKYKPNLLIHSSPSPRTPSRAKDIHTINSRCHQQHGTHNIKHKHTNQSAKHNNQNVKHHTLT